MKNLKYIIIFLLVSSCAISLSDIKLSLGDGYHYIGEGETQRYVYRSFDERNPSIDEISIWPTVLSYDYDENFVIIKQSPNEKAIKQYLVYFKDKSIEFADNLMKTDTFFTNMFDIDTCYWIINKKDKVIKGPLNFTSFQKEKSTIGVSNKLHLRK